MKPLFISLIVVALSTAAMAQASAANHQPASVPVNTPETETNAAVQQTTYVPPTAAERRSRYLKGMFGWAAFARSVTSAGFSTWRNTPSEWGGQWEGLGKRTASNIGKRMIGNTVRYGLEEALELDSSFYRSENRATGARIKNALLSTVTARKPSGRRVIGVPRIVGTYSSHIIAAETWYPKRYSYKDGLKSGTISFGTGTLFNLFREFVRR